MNIIKKFSTIITLSLIIALIPQHTLYPNKSSTIQIVNAATIKLNKTKLTLIIGKSSTLKIIGTKKKVTWSIDKKDIATITKNGKIIARKIGTAKVTATVNSKKYTCTVKVTPYNTKKSTINNISFLIPSSYTYDNKNNSKDSTYYHSITNNLSENATGVMVSILKTGIVRIDYSKFKDKYSKLIKSEFTSANIKPKNYKTSKITTKHGTTFVASFNTTVNNINVKYTYYLLSIDKYLVQVVGINQNNTISTPKINTVAKYILNTISINKSK